MLKKNEDLDGAAWDDGATMRPRANCHGSLNCHPNYPTPSSPVAAELVEICGMASESSMLILEEIVPAVPAWCLSRREALLDHR